MASIKTLCIVFVLTLFGGIRANVDTDATAAKIHSVHKVLPSSILYLLHSRPIGRSPRPIGPAVPLAQSPVPSNAFNPSLPTAPVAPTPPVAPLAPVPPTLPVAPLAPIPPAVPFAPIPPIAPSAPVPPVPPTLPNLPTSGISAGKHVAVHQMFPPSLLYLLQRKPTRRSQTSQTVNQRTLVPTKYSDLPYSALYPSAPVPSVPESQTGPDVNSLPAKSPSPTNPSVPPSGQLSYDNPDNGNRKLLNVVHIPLRPPVSKPVPVPQRAENQPNIAVGPDVGPAPLPPVVQSTSPTEDLTPAPNDTSNVSPVPATPTTDDSKKEVTFNPKDLTAEPVDTIEASPIPVPANNDLIKKVDALGKPEHSVTTEDLSPVPTNTMGSSPIPSKPESAITESGETKDTNTLNPKDLPYQPVNSIEASPIPVKPNDETVKENSQDNVVNTPPQDEPTGANPASSEGENKLPIPTDNAETPSDKPDIVKEDSDNSKNTITINPKDLQSQLVDSIEASPIPVKSNDEENKSADIPNKSSPDQTQPDTASATQDKSSKEELSEQNDNDSKTNSENSQDKSNKESSEKSEGPQNPLGDLILNGTNSDGNENPPTEQSQDNPLKNAILNGTSPGENPNTQSEQPQDNPLKNEIQNDKNQEDKTNSAQESLNAAQSDEASKKNEQTESENGSSEQASSQNEGNAEVSSQDAASSSDNTGSANGSSEESASSNKEENNKKSEKSDC